MTAKLKQLKDELDVMLREHKALEKVLHDQIKAEQARIWLANDAKKKETKKDIPFITRTLSENLKLGDYVKVSGARSGPYRCVVELHGTGCWSGGKPVWYAGGLTAAVTLVNSRTKEPQKTLHDYRYCGIEKVTHILVDGAWIKAADYAERHRSTESE